MDIVVTFPGGRRVDARFGEHLVRTDQPAEHGGSGAFPEPFDLFLASLATCAGAYVLGFCLARGISTDGIEIVQRARFADETHRLEGVELELSLPVTFPEKYRDAIVRAAEGCKVKKTLATPPDVHVTLRAEPFSGPKVARSA
jgi:putative redox protein